VRQRFRSVRFVLAAVSSVLLVVGLGVGTGVGASASSAHSRSTASAQHAGGSLTVLEGSGYAGAWPAGLDPSSNIDGAADQSYMSAIFGQLFELGTGGKIIDDLATGYSFGQGGKLVLINLRQGVKFSDGTPFNGAAVLFNFKRDLESSCSCKPTWPIQMVNGVPNVQQTGPYQVAIHLSTVFAPIISSFIDANVNWIASPTAIQKMTPTAFAQAPVGAGPFTVESDSLSSVLVLKKNPNYWQAGHPYLDTLTFKAVGSDEAALEAMQAGEGQVYEGMSTPSLIQEAKSKFQVVSSGSTSPYDLQLNTAIAPFNNIRAREAIYYATNAAQIDKSIFGGQFPLTESFEGPAGLFYEATVPGYRQYDLAKAKQLVKSIGGLKVNLGTIDVLVAKETTEALQTEWKAAGIHTTLASYDLAALISAFVGKKWQAMVQTAGSYDPAAGVGVGFRFSSTSPFSGVHDPHLDALLNAAASTLNPRVRKADYAAAAEYISQKAYGPFYFAFAGANVSTKGVQGPGISTALPAVVVNPNIPWEDVSAS